MTTRRAMPRRRAAATAAVAAALLLTVAGCSGESDGGDDGKGGASQDADSGGSGGGSGDTDTVLAEVKGGQGGEFTLTINSAQRDDSGFATIKGTLKNDGPTVAVLPGWASDEAELKNNGLSMAGASMIDKQHKKRYFILRDTNGRCLCTRFTGGFEQGQTSEWYAQFPAPPASTTKVDFQVADLPSATVKLSGE